MDPALLTGSSHIFATPTTYTTQIGSTFIDLGFQGSAPVAGGYAYSAINANCNGFYFYGSDSPGVYNQNIKFTRCMMQGFNVHFDFEGTESCSEISHSGCSYSFSATAFYKLNNLQSFNHPFYGTDIEEIYGDGFLIGAGGGGAVRVNGGSFILFDAGISRNGWVVNSPTALTGCIQPLIFNGVRFELRGNYSNLLNVINGNTLRAKFVDCFILDACVAPATKKANWLQVGSLSRVDIDDTMLCQQNNLPVMVSIIDSTGDWGEPGTVQFDGCTLPVDFSDQCAVTGWVGIISAINTQGSNTNDASQTQHHANDFDLLGGTTARGQNAAWSHTALSGAGGLSALQPRVKTAWMKAPAEYLPGAAANEITLKMPKGAVIKISQTV